MFEFLDYFAYQAKYWLFYVQISLAYTWLFWPIILSALTLSFMAGRWVGRRS